MLKMKIVTVREFADQKVLDSYLSYLRVRTQLPEEQANTLVRDGRLEWKYESEFGPAHSIFVIKEE